MCSFVYPIGSALLVKVKDREFAIRVKSNKVYVDTDNSIIIEYVDDLDGQVYNCKQVIKRIDIPIVPFGNQ